MQFPQASPESKSVQEKPTVLIAGVGNVLLGDDGFGIEVANRLMRDEQLPNWVKVMETGIGGMSLIQELMYGYEAVVIVDAYSRGGKAGELYLLEPVLPDLSTLQPMELRDYFADTHYATPIRALSLLDHVGSSPKTTRILGCEPEQLDDMTIGLSPVVEAAVGKAVTMVKTLIKNYPEQGFGQVKPGDKTVEEIQWYPKNQQTP